MIRNFVVRSVEIVIIALATCAFFFLPIGRRTPYGHIIAIFSTPPAKEAADDVVSTGKALRDKVVGQIPTIRPDGGR